MTSDHLGEVRRARPVTPELARLDRVLTISRRVPELRAGAVRSLLESGWTLRKIADECGVSRQAVWEWTRAEQRQTAVPAESAASPE